MANEGIIFCMIGLNNIIIRQFEKEKPKAVHINECMDQRKLQVKAFR